jgi:hypothetical protein
MARSARNSTSRSSTSAFWELRVAIADQYRIGRVFIAGDAAHSHPPYGGLRHQHRPRRRANLGWKLRRRCKAGPAAHLLDSYGEERRPVFASTARDFIEKAIESDRKFLASSIPRRQGCVRSRMAGALVRSAFGSEFVRAELRGLLDRRRPARRRLQCDRVASIRGARRPSSGAAPARVRAAMSSRNWAKGLRCSIFGAPEAAAASIRRAAEASGVPLKLVRDDSAEAREFYEAALVLVRPDQFVAWDSDGDVTDAAGIIRRVVGGHP